jgi:acid phosphatase type 7
MCGVRQVELPGLCRTRVRRGGGVSRKESRRSDAAGPVEGTPTGDVAQRCQAARRPNRQHPSPGSRKLHDFQASSRPRGRYGLGMTCSLVAGGASLFLALGFLPGSVSGASATLSQTPPQTTVVVVAAGDVACDPGDPNYRDGKGTATRCHEKQTAALVRRATPRVVLGLGDMQYEDGAYSKYLVSYAASWGSFKHITYTTPGGGHDALATPTSGYCRYFGAHACRGGRTYYSFDLGAWHIISLDADCAQTDGCAPLSPEEQWLKQDLATHDNRCTLAFWHYPRWSVGQYGDDARSAAFVSDLYSAGADVILTAHDHIYARFAPQTPTGEASPDGISEFVVGTGGKNHMPLKYSLHREHANLQVANADTYGILKLTLRPSSYRWQFIPDKHSPGSFTDVGAASCH